MVHTPREVAQAADITFSMISDTSALSSVANGSDSVLAGLSTGKICVDMSTVSPRLIRDLARKTIVNQIDGRRPDRRTAL